MRAGLTVQELATEVERRAQTKIDYVADTPGLTVLTEREADYGPQAVVGVTELHLNSVGEFGTTDLARGQIADRLGIPQKFARELRVEHPALYDTVINRLFRERPDKRMVRTLDGDARAFLSNRYRPLDDDDLLRAVLPVLGEQPDMRIVSCDATEYRTYLKAVFPRLEAEVKVGDIVQAGIVISNSEVGHGALSVQPLIYRLWCDNGCTTDIGAVRRAHLGRATENEGVWEMLRDETREADDRAFWLKLQDVVRSTVTTARFEQIVAGLRETTERPIEGDPVKAVEVVKTKLELSEDEKGSVMRHLIEGGDLSQYGMLNAITRTANDSESYDRASQLEVAGGKVLAMAEPEWRAVARAGAR